MGTWQFTNPFYLTGNNRHPVEWLSAFGISCPLGPMWLTCNRTGLENPTWLARTAAAGCLTESPGPSKSTGCAEAAGLIRSASPWWVAGSSRRSHAWSHAWSSENAWPSATHTSRTCGSFSRPLYICCARSNALAGFVSVSPGHGSVSATAMEWEAEPNALGFYARMGGRPVRTTTSEWGRELSVMAVPIPP